MNRRFWHRLADLLIGFPLFSFGAVMIISDLGIVIYEWDHPPSMSPYSAGFITVVGAFPFFAGLWLILRRSRAKSPDLPPNADCR